MTERKKAKAWISFGSGWYYPNQEGQFGNISVSIDPNKNARDNKKDFKDKNDPGQGYKMFLVPVDSEGNPLESQNAVEVTEFKIYTSKADKDKYPKAPDYRVTVPVY